MDAAPERPTGRSPRSTRLLVTVAILAAAVGVLAATFDWNWFKPPIERRVTAYTGRPFTISGDLDVDLDRQLSIRLDRVSLGNAKMGIRSAARERRPRSRRRGNLAAAAW